MIQRRVDAKLMKVKGRVKQAIGIVTGSEAMEKEGSRERAEGVARERTLQMRRMLGDFFERAAKKFGK